MAYSSITITRESADIWSIVDNTMPPSDAGYISSEYTGVAVNDLITIGTKTGQPLYKNIPATIIHYVDVTDPDNNFDATSTLSLITYLKSVGFFGSGSGGGGGTATSLLSLTDALFPNYFGRGGQAIIVSPNENGFTTQNIVNPGIQDLSNFLQMEESGEYNLPPNQYLLTSSTVNEDGNAIGFITAPITQIVNRAFMFNESGVTHKGAQVVDDVVIPNQENYTPEIGDIVTFFAFDETTNRIYKYIEAKWLGGSMDDPANYDWGIRVVYAQL